MPRIERARPAGAGLQWMIDFDKENFRGCEASSAAGARLQKKMSVCAEHGCNQLVTGAHIFHDGRLCGMGELRVFWSSLGAWPCFLELAYRVWRFVWRQPAGPAVRTISMPPIMPKA